MTTKTTTEQTTWTIDPVHTRIEFAVRHMMVSTVRGQFRKFEAKLEGDVNDPLGAFAEATIDAASIDTGDEQRDAHLRSPDFFDVERFPALRYVSRRLKQAGDDEFEVEGDLTVRDVTLPLTLKVRREGVVEDPWGNERVGLSAEGSLKRSDFGLKWNMALETGGIVVGDEVKLTLAVEAVRPTVRASAAAP